MNNSQDNFNGLVFVQDILGGKVYKCTRCNGIYKYYKDGKYVGHYDTIQQLVDANQQPEPQAVEVDNQPTNGVKKSGKKKRNTKKAVQEPETVPDSSTVSE